MKTRKIVGGFLTFLFLANPIATSAEMEVPFSVVKTQMKETATWKYGKTLFYNPNTQSWKVAGDGMTEDMGGDMDLLTSGTFVNIEKATYSIKFHNVGELGGGSYGDAELTINYETGGAYKIRLKSGEEILNENGDYYKQLLKRDNRDEIIAHLESQVNEGIIDGEKFRAKVPTGDMDLPSKTIKLSFSGGPYGKFSMKTSEVKEGVVVYGEIMDGDTVVLYPAGANEDAFYRQGLFHLNPDGAKLVGIPIKSDGFEKWLEILMAENGECSDPENPTKDSGVRFSDVWGRVEVAKCSWILDDIWDAGELDMVLHVEDHIKTGYNDSGAVLSLTDMTTFKMRPNTEIVLSEPPGKENKIALVAGKVWANLKKMVKDGSMEVQMSQAVCGIKGTTWVMEDDGEASILKVIEGEVEFTSKLSGESMMVGPGEAAMATTQGLSEKTTFDVETEKTNWENEEAIQGEYQETVTFTYPENTQRDEESGEGNLFVWFTVLVALVAGGVFVLKKKQKEA